MNHDVHDRARKLIALADAGTVSSSSSSNSNSNSDSKDRAWLAAHVKECAACHAFADNARETIHALRAIPIAAERSLVATTQMRVRQRALQMQRQRERLWLVAVSCMAVTVCALFSSIVLWRGFAWLGERAQLSSSIWQTGFFILGIIPALVVGIILLACGTHLPDHSGSYQG